MYKLLIVDDEEIEREGMAQFIPWKDYEVELAGTAWNGVEALEKIETLLPDIVLTDIKMPVMNGIELIRRVRRDFPDIEFIVLSGYGEYEFTSQAMEEGVRHYILKPCDEVQIAGALEKVKKEIQEKRAQKEEKKEYHETVHRLLPRAKEQVFRNLLLEREQLDKDYRLFLDEIGDEEKKIQVLALRSEASFDNLEQFALGNILGELLSEEKVLLSAVIEKDILFLIEEMPIGKIEKAVERTQQELKKIKASPVRAALSRLGELKALGALYRQIQELYRIGGTSKEALVHYGMLKGIKDRTSLLADFERIQNAQDYAQILFEVYLSFLKMRLKDASLKQKEESAGWILKILYGQNAFEKADFSSIHKFSGAEDEEVEWQLLERTVNVIADCQDINLEHSKEEQRVKSILLAVFKYIHNQEMNIQFLAKEVLFMNEDYFGRIFVKNRKVKFSTFLLEQRIELAKRLMQFDPELRIAALAEMVGYSPDGQYFSKAFRKAVGKSPSEYREFLIKSDSET